MLEKFASSNGRAFYKLQDLHRPVTLTRASFVVRDDITVIGEEKVIPFWVDKELNWTIDPSQV